MVEIQVCKADPLFTDRPTQGATIAITGQLPDGDKPFKSDAKAIVQALVRTLPGGTLDQVLVLLLEHRASKLIVAHGPSNG